MNKEETIQRLLKERNITDEDLELIGKIYDLEQDNELIKKVEINKWFGGPFHGSVKLNKPFADLEAFKKYLQNKTLPTEEVKEYKKEGINEFFMTYKPRQIEVRFGWYGN